MKKTILNLLVFKITFDLVYVLVISDIFSYVLFEYEPYLYKYIVSSCVLFIAMPAIIHIISKQDVSSRLLLLLNIMYFIPACTLYALGGLPDKYFVFIGSYWLILMYLNMFFPSIKLALPNTKKVNCLFTSFIVVTISICLFVSGYYNHFKITFDFIHVYDLRNEMKEMNLPSFFSYFMPAASVIVPILIVYFIINKKNILAIFLTFIQILMFSIGGMKKTLFFLPIVFFLYYFFKNRDFKIILNIFSIINILAIVEYLLLRNPFPFIANFIQRRTMLTPVMISYNYIDYFSHHDPDYLSQSVLGRLGIQSEYDTDIQNLISGVYYDNYDGVASNGIAGDAFGNFGWFSLLFYPLMFIFTLRIVNACSKGIDQNILLVLSVIYAVYFTNGSFFSTLLTNGLILISLFLYIFPRRSKECLYEKK